MHREIPKILAELDGLTWEKLVEILSDRSQELDIYPTSTLSLKQTMYVYEWYEQNKDQFASVIRAKELKKQKKKDNPQKKVPFYVAESLKTKEKIRKEHRLSKDQIKFVPVGNEDFSMPSENKKNSSTKQIFSRNPEIRRNQERIIRERRMKEIGPDAHIIYIPAGGQNKKR